jgi:BirA family transcriptional regulator, biotin operon repressor / biotin---[acetyl-CoA-carboxylase] ligase
MTARREYHDEIRSTQTRAVDLARKGAPVGTRVVAGRQTNGIGRLGHRWESPPGGLYVSVLVAPSPAGSSLLPLAVGASVAERLEREWKIAPQLKWPNDLVIPGTPGPPRKLGGVIVDVIEGAPAGRVAVVGVGLNVRTPPGGLPSTRPLAPVSVDELVPTPPTVDDAERAVVSAVEEGAAALAGVEGRRTSLERCRRLLYGVGRSVLVDGRPAGRIRGLAEDGTLEVDHDGEPMTIRAGDLTVLDP